MAPPNADGRWPAEGSLGELIAETRSGSLPARAVELAKVGIADTVGVGVAGAHSDVPRALAHDWEDDSSCRDATVWGRPLRGRVSDVAEINAVAGHSLDWDDYSSPMHGHCSTVLAPVCMALAEAQDDTGRELIAAYLVGYEVNGQLGRIFGAEHYERGWHSTGTLGVLGAAASAAYLLRLTPDQANAALGIAASYASGLRVNLGTMAKQLHAGHAARSGIAAAALARQGVTASSTWLLGRFGLLATYGARMTVDEAWQLLSTDIVVGGSIEREWGLVLKPYPSCGSGHAAIDAILEIVGNEQIKVEEVLSIQVHVDPLVTSLLSFDDPRDSYEARYSLPYTIAVAALNRTVGATEFEEGCLFRSDVRALMNRVHVVEVTGTDPRQRLAATVVLETSTGRRQVTVDHAAGHPLNPMSEPDRRRKFELAVGESLPDAKALYECLRDLEGVDNVHAITEKLRIE